MAAHGYLFVYETLLNQMESHLLTPGMQLPSEMELAQELGVSRMTARKALTRLEEENRIFRRVGVGTFVKSVAVAFDSPKRRFNVGIEARSDLRTERPPMMQIITEAQRACSEQDCNLLLLSREELLAGENIDAAFFPHLELKDFPEALRLSRRMPTVLLNRITDEPELSYIAVDYVEASCRIIRRFLENGAKNIMLVDGTSQPELSYTRFSRELGYRKAYEQLGRKVNEELILQYLRTEWYEAIAEKLICFKPDVIFVSCEVVMPPICSALKAYGKSLNKKVHLFCFDDMQDFTMPGIGSISYGRMPFRVMCSRAIEYLSGRLRKTIPDEPIHEIYPLSYVITECPFLI